MAQPTDEQINEARRFVKAEADRRPLIEKMHAQYAKGLITSVECTAKVIEIIASHPVELPCSKFHEAED